MALACSLLNRKASRKHCRGRRRGDAQFPEIIANDGDRRRGVARRFILDDLQVPQPCALVAAATDEETPIRRGREQDRAGG